MKVMSIAALPLVAMLAIPGSASTTSQSSIVKTVAPMARAGLAMQADRLIAVQSQSGFTIDPNVPVELFVRLPRTADAIPFDI